MIHWGSATAKLGLGRLEDAEHHALRHEAIAARLTPHHEVHAIGNLVTLDEAAGRWDRLHERRSGASVPSQRTPTRRASTTHATSLPVRLHARRLGWTTRHADSRRKSRRSASRATSSGSIRCGRGSR